MSAFVKTDAKNFQKVAFGKKKIFLLGRRNLLSFSASKGKEPELMKQNHTFFTAFLIACISLLISMSSCEDNPEPDPVSEFILGEWIYARAEADTLVQLQRINNPGSDIHYFSFMDDKTMIERGNAGWCGTPPITYVDYNGTWEWTETDSVFSFEVGFWGGTTSVSWKIIEVDEDKLVVYELEREVDSEYMK